MTIHLKYPKGATPLDPNEIAGLIPSYISTQEELDAAEQANVIEADGWVISRRRKEVLTGHFIQRLHKRMFGRVWKWAGQYRKTDKSIGVHWAIIATEVKKLCDDASYWTKNKTYPWPEIGPRFHHRLVSIHPFPNGNGRHARLMTDVLLMTHGQDRFTWGSHNPNTARKRYLEALKEADQQRFGPLIKFVKS